MITKRERRRTANKNEQKKVAGSHCCWNGWISCEFFFFSIAKCKKLRRPPNLYKNFLRNYHYRGNSLKEAFLEYTDYTEYTTVIDKKEINVWIGNNITLLILKNEKRWEPMELLLLDIFAQSLMELMKIVFVYLSFQHFVFKHLCQGKHLKCSWN